MEVSAVSGALASQASQASQAQTSAVSSDFETFLQMLTVQMQNQDPLNPVESTDFAVQLATFSSVEQQVLTNQHLTSLASSLGVSGLGDQAALIGREVLSPSAAQFDGDPLAVQLDLPIGADRHELIVYDESRTEVNRITVPAGETELNWYGSTAQGGIAPDGAYSFSLESFSGEAMTDRSDVSVWGKVAEVRLDGQSNQLLLAGGSMLDATAVEAVR